MRSTKQVSRGTGFQPVQAVRTGCKPVPRATASGALLFFGVITLIAPASRGAVDQKLDARRYACWNNLPASDARLEDFASSVDQLRRESPDDPWLSIFDLYLAYRRHDTNGMLAANIAAPGAFPPAAVRQAQFHDATAGGASPVQAGLTLLTKRSYDPLRALRDLDEGLTAAARDLRSHGRADDAAKLESSRDRLRQAYLPSSKDLIERLFALNLLGHTQEARDLLQQARRLRYLTDEQDMAVLLARLGPNEAWQRVVLPLLADEVSFIQHPPDLKTLQRPAMVDMTVTAASRSAQGGTANYRGAVSISVASLHVSCDALSIDIAPDGTPSLLSGSGNASVRGAAGTTHVQSREFTYNPTTGVFTFAGDVRVTRRGREENFRSCTLTATGELRNAKAER